MERFVPVRPWAVFTTDFPDDQADKGPELAPPSGRNVAEAIAGVLRGLGCEVQELLDGGDHGWEFGASLGRRRFWCQVTSFYPLVFLLFEDDPPVQAPSGHTGLAEKLSRALRADGRFHDLLWYTRAHGPTEEPDGRGTESPLAADPSELAAAGRRKPILTGRNLLLAVGWLLLCAAYYAAKRYLPGL